MNPGQPLLGTLPAIAATLVSGVALAFAWPEANLAPLAWVGLVPLLVLIGAGNRRRALALGLAFGAGFYGTLLVWISIVGWRPWTALVLLQAAYSGLFAVGLAVAIERFGRAAALALAPALWVAVDFLRSLFPVGGFTWGQLSQSQHDLLWMLRPAALGGAWLVTGLLVAVNALLAYAVLQMAARRYKVTGACLLAAIAAVGAPALLPANVAMGAPLRVAIVQGDVPRNWTGTTLEKEIQIIESHAELTRSLAGRDIDLVVWPESAIGIDIENDPFVAEVVWEAARAVDAPMIVGGNLDVGTDHYKVMAFLISPDGAVVDRYQKTHLVPFGEYVPARSLLGWLPGLERVPRDAIPADESVLFEISGEAVAPVISFEGDFGSLVRGRIDDGGRLLVIATNTSTWEESWASAQHVAFAQLRAAETGVAVIHAAISGISAFVAPDGEVLQSTPLWEPATMVRDIRFAESITPYARYGDWFPLVCILAAIGSMLLRRRRSP